MFRNLLSAAALILCLGSASAQAPASSTKIPVLKTDVLITLLDSEASIADRQAAMKVMQESAAAGNSYAMYNLGSLARQARFKDDPVTRYDPGAALMWLTRAFDHGRITAAFKLAVVHRDLGDNVEAMAWLQVYTYYMKGHHLPADKQRPLPKRGAVVALLATLQAETKATPEETIRQRTIVLLSEHGTRYERAVPTPTEGIEGCRMRPPPKGFRNSVARRVDASLVELVAVVEPDGSAREMAVLDSTPDFMSASLVRQFGFAVACPKLEDNSDDRRVFIGFDYWGYMPSSNRQRLSL